MMNFFRLLLCSFFSVLLLLPSTSYSQKIDGTDGKILISQATVNIPVDKAWWGWTTDKGVQSFLAVDSKIDFRVDGNYNISLYTKDNFPHSENRILSFIPFRMFTFELEMPNKFSTIQKEKTQVVVEFTSLSDSQTDVRVTQVGWQKQGEWLAAYDYFQQTWLLALADMQTNLVLSNPYGKNENTKSGGLPTMNDEKQEKVSASVQRTVPSASTPKKTFDSSTATDIDGIAPPTSKKAANVTAPSPAETPPTPAIIEENTSQQNTENTTDMQQFAYKLTLTDPELARNPEAWTAEQNAVIGVHFNYLKKLTEEGTVIMAGRSPDPETGFGIVVLEASSSEVAQEIMNNDPAVKNGLMSAEFHDFHIALMREK